MKVQSIQTASAIGAPDGRRAKDRRWPGELLTDRLHAQIGLLTGSGSHDPGIGDEDDHAERENVSGLAVQTAALDNSREERILPKQSSPDLRKLRQDGRGIGEMAPQQFNTCG